MKKYKATFITVTKQYKTVEVPDDEAKDDHALRTFVCNKLIDFGADNEETVNTSLAVLEDITPPEEHGPAEHGPERYADWYVKAGAIYFRSNKTNRDYQVMRLNSAGYDGIASSVYAIVEMLLEQGITSYGKAIDTFIYTGEEYIPDFNEKYNEYISTAIQKYENGVADEQ